MTKPMVLSVSQHADNAARQSNRRRHDEQHQMAYKQRSTICLCLAELLLLGIGIEFLLLIVLI